VNTRRGSSLGFDTVRIEGALLLDVLQYATQCQASGQRAE
jgi:hypothetical protein